MLKDFLCYRNVGQQHELFNERIRFPEGKKKKIIKRLNDKELICTITMTEVAAFKCTLVVKEIRLLQLFCLKIHWIVSLAVDVKANFWRGKSQSAGKKTKPLNIEFLGGMKRLRNNSLKITQL